MSNDKELIDMGKNVIESVASDVYKDLAQPAARRIGNAIDSLAKIALSPIALLDFGFEQSKEWLHEKIKKKITNTPEEYISAPPNNIAIPALMRISMSNDTPELRELYAELLLKAMDSRTSDLVHPSYVLIIEQMSSEEAFIFISLHPKADKVLFEEKSSQYKSSSSIPEQFSKYCHSIGIANVKNSEIWLENLTRLNLLQIINYSESEYIPEQVHKHGVESPRVDTTDHKHLEFTAFGRGFIEACAPSV